MKGAASTAPRYAIPNYFTNPVIRPYLANVRNWQCYIRFLGLPDRRDNPDILIDRLFVTPLLARKYISPDENPKSWADEAETLLDVLSENSPLVLLGDPGIGKSTFLNYVAWLLSRPADNALIDRMGWRLPLPMVLRELPVRGVTEFDGLLEAFLGREMSAPLREDDGRYLRQALAEGQAFVLLDGIDELGDRKARENLRSAVFDGMVRYPDCRWLLTSRIVGYEEVSFDTERSQSDEEWFVREPNKEAHEGDLRLAFREFHRMKRESASGRIPIRYIAPFDDRRIAAFARNWYVRREASASRAHANADHLVRAVHADESILRLARVPNLLTMMALIHRIEATLPHGRALLYERIAEAYLESIDKFRGIESSPHDLPRKKGWLARVGFEMQRRRMAGEWPSGTNILVDADTVRDWLSEEMGRSYAVLDTPSTEEFLKATGRRSGLFLPRGKDRYAFIHLSFQEYFAAVALKREVTRLQWAKGNSSRLGFDRDTLAEWAGQSLWRETFAFLFELLASEDDDDWHADLLDCVFGEEFSYLSEEDVGQDEHVLNLTQLLARLVINSRSGLTSAKRHGAIARCVSIQFRITPRKPWPNVISILLGDDVQLNEEVFDEVRGQMERLKLWTLDLGGARITDISPLSNYTNLKLLDLAGTPVSDLSPIKNLASLRSLDLTETLVSDLSPLSKLSELQSLVLILTKISDITPITGLTYLRSLNLLGTPVSDLSPLTDLPVLQSLVLMDMQIENFEVITKLRELQSLEFGDVIGADLRLLANLPKLQSLALMGAEISDLTPISNLPALEKFELVGTKVSDITPLANLITLRSFECFDAPLSDLSPLGKLPALESLCLDATSVSDISPLENCTSLRSLQLYGREISDLSPLANVVTLNSLALVAKAALDLAPLADLPALQELNLYGSSIPDLAPLASLSPLRRIYLEGTKTSVAMVEELRKVRPELHIAFQGIEFRD